MSTSDEVTKQVDALELDEDEVDANNNSNNEEEGVELSDSINEPAKNSAATLPVNKEERDEEMEDFARQFKSIYESKFIEYLKNLKRLEPLNATSLPETKYNKETYDQDTANSTTILFYFDKLETDEKGNVNAIVTKSFDKTEVCHFQPYLCNDYGPYFNTNLYCCLYNTGRAGSEKAQNFFLELPIDLYNLIE